MRTKGIIVFKISILDEKQRSSSAESDSRRTSIRTRSLSAESSKDTRSNSTISNKDKLDILGDEKNGRPKPVRENSYLTAVRNNPGQLKGSQ